MHPIRNVNRKFCIKQEGPSYQTNTSLEVFEKHVRFQQVFLGVLKKRKNERFFHFCLKKLAKTGKNGQK